MKSSSDIRLSIASLKKAKPTMRYVAGIVTESYQHSLDFIEMVNSSLYNLLKKYNLQQYTKKLLHLGINENRLRELAYDDKSKRELYVRIKVFPGHTAKFEDMMRSLRSEISNRGIDREDIRKTEHIHRREIQDKRQKEWKSIIARKTIDLRHTLVKSSVSEQEKTVRFPKVHKENTRKHKLKEELKLANEKIMELTQELNKRRVSKNMISNDTFIKSSPNSVISLPCTADSESNQYLSYNSKDLTPCIISKDFLRTSYFSPVKLVSNKLPIDRGNFKINFQNKYKNVFHKEYEASLKKSERKKGSRSSSRSSVSCILEEIEYKETTKSRRSSFNDSLEYSNSGVLSFN